MYRVPTARRPRKKDIQKLNLIPILDAVFIYIFFLLASTTFIQIFEIGSNKPIVSDQAPKDDKRPLALTLEISNDQIVVKTGVPSRIGRVFKSNTEGEFDLDALHQYALELKKNYLHEDDAVLIPKVDLPYAELIKIIDAIRSTRATDEALYRKDRDGIDVKLETLFSTIVFGNILS